MTRALVLYSHPVPESFGGALHTLAVDRLRLRGWEVDDCDLYAENFSPVLTTEERRGYHDQGPNIEPVRAYVERVQAADALILMFPVWNFGYPAMLKGFFDRVFLPGVSFRLENGRVRGNLRNIRKIAAIVTYGGSRRRALLVGDPPRNVVTRAVGAMVHPLAKRRYLAIYDMNRADDSRRARFLSRVAKEMDQF